LLIANPIPIPAAFVVKKVSKIRSRSASRLPEECVPDAILNSILRFPQIAISKSLAFSRLVTKAITHSFIEGVVAHGEAKEDGTVAA
jgi:hypothetical protein